MWAMLAVHGAAALALASIGDRLGRRAFLLAAVAPLLTLGYLLTVSRRVIDGEILTDSFRWVPQLGLDIGLRLDGMGLLMSLLISGIGVSVFLYARWYFADGRGLGRAAALLVAFAGSMLGIVLADNLLALYLFWELTSVTSFLLIGFDDERASARSAALKAFLVTGAGGLAMLAGFVLMGRSAGTFSLSQILASPPTGPVVAAALVLILLGAFTIVAEWR